MPEEDKLSNEEQAYFNSRGADVPEPKPGTPSIPSAPELEAGDVDGNVEPVVAEKPDTVPLAKLLEERKQSKEAAKALKAQMAEIERKSAVWEDRWNTMLRQPEQPTTPVAEAPDPDVDVFAALKHTANEVNTLKAAEAARVQALQQTEQAQQQENAIWNYWDQGLAEARGEIPDFGDAATWLSETRVKELSAYAVVDNRFSNSKMIDWQINQELKSIIVTAAQQHKNPAQLVYELAKGRGYTGPKPKADDMAAAATALEKTEKAIAGSTSLSSVGGSAPVGEPDAAAIANMSPEQFDAWFSKAGNKTRFRKLAGG